jgi:hypothetical protein
MNANSFKRDDKSALFLKHINGRHLWFTFPYLLLPPLPHHLLRRHHHHHRHHHHFLHRNLLHPMCWIPLKMLNLLSAEVVVGVGTFLVVGVVPRVLVEVVWKTNRRKGGKNSVHPCHQYSPPYVTPVVVVEPNVYWSP